MIDKMNNSGTSDTPPMKQYLELNPISSSNFLLICISPVLYYCLPKVREEMQYTRRKKAGR